MAVSKRTKRWADNPTNVIAPDVWSARRSRERQADRILEASKGKKKIPAFFDSPEWKRVRYQVLKRDGGKCQCCGRSAKQGAVMNVDHIKPRLKYPKLALKMSNLQTLCASCNQGKGGKDETDWR